MQYLPSDDHKIYDHVSFQILQILSTFQVNNFHVTLQYMLSGGNQTDVNSLERFLTPYQNSRVQIIINYQFNE